MLKKFKDYIITALFIIAGILLLIILLPFIIISGVNNHFEEKRLAKLYQEYLSEIEGHKFFCYNNRRNTQYYIEQHIIPKLPTNVKVIFLDGRTPYSATYSKVFLSTLLYNIRHKIGFPYLLRIQNGLVIEKSLNNEVYNSLNQAHNIEILDKVINEFYQ